MEKQNAGHWVKIVMIVGFLISGITATYLVITSKKSAQAIKTGGDLTLITSNNQTFKLIPEECHFQKIHDLNIVTLNSHNSFDLIAEYSAGQGGITTLTVKNPSDNKVTTFKKSECELFKDSFEEANHLGSIEITCLRDGMNLKGKMYFADCPAK